MRARLGSTDSMDLVLGLGVIRWIFLESLTSYQGDPTNFFFKLG